MFRHGATHCDQADTDMHAARWEFLSAHEGQDFDELHLGFGV
jgi:hypothetical protein